MSHLYPKSRPIHQRDQSVSLFHGLCQGFFDEQVTTLFEDLGRQVVVRKGGGHHIHCIHGCDEFVLSGKD